MRNICSQHRTTDFIFPAWLRVRQAINYLEIYCNFIQWIWKEQICRVCKVFFRQTSRQQKPRNLMPVFSLYFFLQFSCRLHRIPFEIAAEDVKVKSETRNKRFCILAKYRVYNINLDTSSNALQTHVNRKWHGLCEPASQGYVASMWYSNITFLKLFLTQYGTSWHSLKPGNFIS